VGLVLDLDGALRLPLGESSVQGSTGSITASQSVVLDLQDPGVLEPAGAGAAVVAQLELLGAFSVEERPADVVDILVAADVVPPVPVELAFPPRSLGRVGPGIGAPGSHFFWLLHVPVTSIRTNTIGLR